MDSILGVWNGDESIQTGKVLGCPSEDGAEAFSSNVKDSLRGD